MAEHQNDELLSTKQAAAWLHVSTATLLTWRKSGHLPSQKIGTRYFYRSQDVRSCTPHRIVRKSDGAVIPARCYRGNWFER